MVFLGSEPQRKSDSGLRVALPGTRAMEEEHESYPRFTFLRHLSILELREQVYSLLVRPLGFYTKTLIVYFGKTLSLGPPNLWTLSSWWGWRGAVVEAGSWPRDRAASPGTVQAVVTRSMRLLLREVARGDLCLSDCEVLTLHSTSILGLQASVSTQGYPGSSDG